MVTLEIAGLLFYLDIHSCITPHGVSHTYVYKYASISSYQSHKNKLLKTGDTVTTAGEKGRAPKVQHTGPSTQTLWTEHTNTMVD
jgi:hypothetical protein